jgi:hypothetical protein
MKQIKFAGEEIDLHDLCYLIYQGFGQNAVEDFVHHTVKNYSYSLYSQLEMRDCIPCEARTTHHESVCLVCSTIHTIEVV